MDIVTAPIMDTIMVEPMRPTALVRLMTLMSPSFPIGAFAYSHGLERAIHDGFVVSRDELVDWLSDIVSVGSGWNDAVLLSLARRARDDGEVRDLAEFAEALAGSAERHLETTAQGRAFAMAARTWPDAVPASLVHGGAYPVIVGAVARQLELPLDVVLPVFLNSFISNLVQAAVRLVPLGQTDGVAAIAALEPAVLCVAERAAAASLDDLGSATVVSDLLSMTHEIQKTRLFRS